MLLPRLGFWAFALLSLLIGLISLRFLVQPLSLVMDHMAHYVPKVPLALYGHLLAAPLAMMLAPFQLWAGLRNRWRGLHRWMGRTYALAVLIAGVSSLVLLPEFLGTVWAMCGFLALAVLWLGSTAMGVIRARQGHFAAHRAWMLRSVALTFAAVTLRLYMAPLIASGWTVVETYDVTAWACWLPNLMAVEMYLRRAGARVAFA